MPRATTLTPASISCITFAINNTHLYLELALLGTTYQIPLLMPVLCLILSHLLLTPSIVIAI